MKSLTLHPHGFPRAAMVYSSSSFFYTPRLLMWLTISFIYHLTYVAHLFSGLNHVLLSCTEMAVLRNTRTAVPKLFGLQTPFAVKYFSRTPWQPGQHKRYLGISPLLLRSRACFKKKSSLHIWPKNFWTTFFSILPQNLTFYLSKILMTFFSLFLVIALFYDLIPITLFPLS